MDAQFQKDIRVAGTIPGQHAQPVQQLLTPGRERTLSASGGGKDSNQKSQKEGYSARNFEKMKRLFHGSIIWALQRGGKCLSFPAIYHREHDGELPKTV
jgi:hypothetical protein